MKGTISIKNPSVDNSDFLDYAYCQTVEFVNSKDGNALSREIFYACASCDGALVPIATCTYCKRISLRKCTKCDKPKTQSHDSCIILISFRNKIAQKSTEEIDT